MVEDAQNKGEGSEQEVNEMPWINYLYPSASTKLITKRCVPFSVYIGIYYVIQLACCICAVNFYGDADRFNSCKLDDAEKNLPENAMKIYDRPLLLMSIYHLIEWIKTTLVLTVTCVGINLMYLYYPLILNTVFGVGAWIYTMMVLFSEDGQACMKAQPTRGLWLRIDVIIFVVTFFLCLGPLVPLRFCKKSDHDEILNKKDDDDEEGSDED